METYWWGPHLFGWMWILPLSFMVVCFFFLFAYLFRGPRWFYGRKDRHDLSEAAREILDRRYASGEISREQYEEMKRVLAS
jgi:putative membrane protein